MERVNLKKLNEVEVREQHYLKVQNSFVTLENIVDFKGTSRLLENIREDVKISAKENLGHYEWKQHKLGCDEAYSKFKDQCNQTKL
jgi:hypothetical protein